MKNDRPNQLPKARKDKLIIKELPDETLVYDLESDKAHCLNNTSGLVWKNCDGTNTIGQLARLIEGEVGGKVSNDVVWLALDQLEEFKLLIEPVSKPPTFGGMSRRELVRILGAAAAAAIPLITSIAVPTPAQAASCGAPIDRDNDCPCTSSAQCTSGCCRDVGGGVLQCKSGMGGCI